MRLLCILALLLTTVSLTAQVSNLSVGDTVVLKAKHRSTGVVLAFTGPGACPPCVESLVDLDRRLKGTRLPIEVYVSDGLESATATLLQQELTYAKLFDDETYAAAQQYRVLVYPTIAVISPSGVVRYVGTPGVKSDNASALSPAIGSVLSEGPYLEFRGPAHQRAQLVRSFDLPTEVLARNGMAPSVLFDHSKQQFLCWTITESSTAYVLGSDGRIATRYDMSAVTTDSTNEQLEMISWDNESERVLVSNTGGRPTRFSIYWYNLKSHSRDTVPYRLEGQLRGSTLQYHPTMKAVVQNIHLPSIIGEAYADSNTVYVQWSDRARFARRRSSLYDRDTFLPNALYTAIATCPTGLLTSQVLTDTIYHLDGNDLTETAYHVSLPEQYQASYKEAMKMYIESYGTIRSGKTMYSELLGLFGDWKRRQFTAQFIVPSHLLDNVERKPFFDKVYMMVDYNMVERRITSTYELPQLTQPIAVDNGLVICRQFKQKPARISWFSPPTSAAGR